MKNIYQALFNIQSELSSVAKDGYNPHFKSKHATLETVLDTIMPYMQKNGLVVVQKPIVSDKVGTLLLRTEIIHVESSESVFSELETPLTKMDSQGVGSAITYARRYSLLALLALGTEDDDGEGTTIRNKPATKAPAKKIVINTEDQELIDQLIVEYPSGDLNKKMIAAKAHLGTEGSFTEEQRKKLDELLNNT